MDIENSNAIQTNFKYLWYVGVNPDGTLFAYNVTEVMKTLISNGILGTNDKNNGKWKELITFLGIDIEKTKK